MSRSATKFPERLLSAGSRPNSDLEFVLPQPTNQGVAELQELYYAEFGRRLDEDSAREALGSIITILWNTALTHLACSNTASTHANHTTSEK